MKVRQVERWVEPSHFRQDQNLPFGRISVYSSGKGGWLHSQQGVSMALPPAVLKQVQEELFRNHFRLYLSDLDGARAVAALARDRVEISDKQGNLVRITMDTATGLPVVLSYHAAQTGGPGLPVEERIEEWKDINGLKIPWRITIAQAGEVYAELRVQDFRWNTGLNAADLARVE